MMGPPGSWSRPYIYIYHRKTSINRYKVLIFVPYKSYDRYDQTQCGHYSDQSIAEIPTFNSSTKNRTHAISHSDGHCIKNRTTKNEIILTNNSTLETKNTKSST